MAFNVSYSAGGVIDEIKKIGQLNGGSLNNIEVIEAIETLKNVDVVKLLEAVETVNRVLEVSEVKTVNVVDKVAAIHGFPQFTKPYNTMVKIDVPALHGEYRYTYTTPDYPVEILAFTVTCTGYGEMDKYDIYCNGEKWFDNWYCQEVKEGLFLGSSTIVYCLPANSEIELVFKNDSGTSKIVWFGLRMLKE